jgi:hypothetical protein
MWDKPNQLIEGKVYLVMDFQRFIKRCIFDGDNFFCNVTKIIFTNVVRVWKS